MIYNVIRNGFIIQTVKKMMLNVGKIMLIKIIFLFFCTITKQVIAINKIIYKHVDSLNLWRKKDTLCLKITMLEDMPVLKDNTKLL
jgi:hypothetical protein